MTTALEGRIALVTGASRGIGAAVAAGLAREGADVAVGYESDVDAASRVVSRIARAGRRAPLKTPGRARLIGHSKIVRPRGCPRARRMANTGRLRNPLRSSP